MLSKMFIIIWLKCQSDYIQSAKEGLRQRPNKADAYSAEYCLFNPLSDCLRGKREIVMSWKRESDLDWRREITFNWKREIILS